MLRPREAGIVRAHYGIGLERALSLAEIGARLRISRERVHQIERGALARLRRSSLLDDYRSFGLPAPPD